jgi:hypothetical protein
VTTIPTITNHRISSQDFNVRSINIVKNKQSNRTKTVDTEKRSSSERSNDLKFRNQDNAPKSEEVPVKKQIASGLY